MKTLILCFILSLFIHTALLFNYNNQNNNSNSISAAKSHINVEIIHSSQGIKQAEDISGIDDISQKQADNNIYKKVEKGMQEKNKNIKKYGKKSELKTAKKGNEGYKKHHLTLTAMQAIYLNQNTLYYLEEIKKKAALFLI